VENERLPNIIDIARCRTDTLAGAIYAAGLAEGEKKGREEVVRWLLMSGVWGNYPCYIQQWQAKLKEWGIEP